MVTLETCRSRAIALGNGVGAPIKVLHYWVCCVPLAHYVRGNCVARVGCTLTFARLLPSQLDVLDLSGLYEGSATNWFYVPNDLSQFIPRAHASVDILPLTKPKSNSSESSSSVCFFLMHCAVFLARAKISVSVGVSGRPQ